MARNNEKLKYSEKDGYYFDIKNTNECADISYNFKTGENYCIPSYDINILKKMKI